MNLELESYPGELKHLREEVERWQEIVRNENAMTQKYKDGYDAAMRIVKSTYPDRFPDIYFICGEGGEKDKNGLPDKIYVCPAYGVDWFQVYEKTNVTTGPEW